MNLLPQEEIKTLKRESTIRLIVAICFLVIFLEVISILMLLPSYIVVNMERNMLTNSSEQIKKTVSGKGSIEDELKAAGSEIQAFVNREETTKDSVTSLIKKVLSLRPLGVSSNSISVIQDSTGGVVQVSGVGVSREALIEFQRILLAQEFVKEAHYLEKFIMQKSNINYSLVISIK